MAEKQKRLNILKICIRSKRETESIYIYIYIYVCMCVRFAKMKSHECVYKKILTRNKEYKKFDMPGKAFRVIPCRDLQIGRAHV